MSPDRISNFVPLESLTSRRPRYWQSLDQLRGEFPPEAHEDHDDEEEHPLAKGDGESRRRFLELMAASLALAGAAGCTRQPPEAIMPYVDPPESVIPGRPRYYATAAIN